MAPRHAFRAWLIAVNWFVEHLRIAVGAGNDQSRRATSIEIDSVGGAKPFQPRPDFPYRRPLTPLLLSPVNDQQVQELPVARNARGRPRVQRSLVIVREFFGNGA